MIPKIIHQLWIGSRPAPTSMMQTWIEKNPDYEYILWNDDSINTLYLECRDEIKRMKEINGQADIIRWEILYQLGGVFIDADSICIEPLDYLRFCHGKTAFSVFENEVLREGLVATGMMGFVPKHPLCRDILDWLKTDEAHQKIDNYRAWYSVGPGLLTDRLNTGKYPDFSVFPSFLFYPIHFTQSETDFNEGYMGHKKVYAHQAWGTGKQNYDQLTAREKNVDTNSMVSFPLVLLPPCFMEPREAVSILISSYNTPLPFVKDCLMSIQNQVGYFTIEIVWINDGSTFEHSQALRETLANFEKTSRWIKIIYRESKENRGTRVALREGVLLCSNEIIVKMDSDDIMLPHRIQSQLDFFCLTPDCPICGSNMVLFEENREKEKIILNTTEHPEIFTWEEFLSHSGNWEWFMNHPTLCFKKSAILEIGNYCEGDTLSMMEDFDLEIRFLKHYRKIYNIQESLLLYRVHAGQLTQTYPSDCSLMKEWREKIVGHYLS